ncbi:hypothetical protein SJAG_02131 [Schizosaccharomyces japonicus yFS275]|uniref:Maltase n=1 Tax=Schizosaccharomyces japonicus (strain yFS275 / FY16936) TaxID=402676 RepID=B6K1M0_SCHJY|nr:hypothetical protein SJAG_02131 [Schizosaccharomyces japonicus yFS275]EEB07051.2 hypothetical protein SJAG_02131 [Schizosaccharomyces japonicus yFS275]
MKTLQLISSFLAAGCLYFGKLSTALPASTSTTTDADTTTTSAAFASDAYSLYEEGTSTSTSWRTWPTLDPELDVGHAVAPSFNLTYLGDTCTGYKVLNVSESSNGVQATLQLRGEACYAYGTDYKYLQLNVSYETEDRIHVGIYDTDGKQFRFSERKDIWDAPLYHDASFPKDRKYEFHYNEDPFEFWVTRTSDNDTLFDTRGQKLIFEDQYIELTTNMVQNYNIYGLAETIHGLRLGNNITRTLWANDEPTPLDRNMYGNHPFYLEHRYANQTNSGKASSHGVLLLSSTGMDILLRENYLQYRVIGGVVDLYIFAGGSEGPKNTISSYVNAVGLPAMQQYWTLGYHQCRWGYESLSKLEEVVENFEKANIPLDTIWGDIDYMYEWRDFTLDPVSYPAEQFRPFLGNLSKNHKHYVPIVDAAVYAANPSNKSDDTYYPFYEGVEKDIFLKNPDGSLYIGAVWPGYTVFADFINPNSTEYWKNCLYNWSLQMTDEGLAFDGLWLDMNEVSSYCVGSCGTGKLDQNPIRTQTAFSGEMYNYIFDYPEGTEYTNASEYQVAMQGQRLQDAATSTAVIIPTASPSTKAKKNEDRNINYPPYAINNEQGNHDISNHIVGVNATSYDGTARYDIFNMYGYGETKATYRALLELAPNVRPFVVPRSTFPGSGVYGAHWLGDNHSKWSNMFFSIPGAMIFNMLGIPMVGADVCGFMGNSNYELCSRWMAMGAFLPFYRSHNTLGAISQEPYIWSSVAEASRRAMKIRYAMLPYWYTLLYQAHAQGTPVFRPMFFEFPEEPSLADASRQFMVGDAFLVTPVLEPNTTTVDGVFPGDNSTAWYDWYTHEAVNQPALTTYETRNNPWALLVALNPNGNADGFLYADDGVSITPNATLSVSFSALNNTLSTYVSGTYAVEQPLANVTVLGVSSAPQSVFFKGQNISSYEYNNDKQELVITNLANLTSQGAFNENWTLTW